MEEISKWSNRFTWTAIIQGAIVTALAIMLTTVVITSSSAQNLVSIVLGNPAVGFIEIAALAGLGLYIIIGVVATGLSAQFYHHFETRLGKKYGRRKVANSLAWAHLILMNVGIAAASMMMIYGGYLGDFAVSSKDESGYGWGWSIEQASEHILNPLIIPVGIMLLIASIGAICGGISFVIVNLKKDDIR